MLEKFANEDDEDDAGDYYISSGGNYSYMYDSPFNPSQDQQHLLSKLVTSLSILETAFRTADEQPPGSVDSQAEK